MVWTVKPSFELMRELWRGMGQGVVKGVVEGEVEVLYLLLAPCFLTPSAANHYKPWPCLKSAGTSLRPQIL